MKNSLLSPGAAAAFSLVEVALALGVAAFCLIPVFGLLPLGVNTNRISFEQTGAANVASAIVADLRATVLAMPPADQSTAAYLLTIPGTPAGSATSFTAFYVRQDGTLCGTVAAPDLSQSPHYRVTVYFTAAGAVKAGVAANPNTTAARLLITWPALADSDATKPPARFAGSFETVVGLVRN